MRRYWLDSSKFSKEYITIDGDSFKHIVGVCRMDVGSHFEVLNENSKAYFVEMTEVGKKVAQAKILEERHIQPLRKPYIHLVLSVPKFQTLESLVEKSVELGVFDIHLVTSEYSFMKDKGDVFTKKLPRWNKIVMSATQQTGRGDLMKIHQPVSLAEFLRDQDFDPDHQLPIFAYEGESKMSLKNAVKDISGELTDVWIFVGPEGGFSLQEVQGIRSRGVEPVTLGEQVLRVETAGVALISAIKYELDLF